MIIKIEVDEKIYNATETYLKKRGGDDTELCDLLTQGAASSLDKAYSKYVPKAVRDYIDLEKSFSKKKKSVSQDTLRKEDVTDEQRTTDGQSY